MKPLLQIVHVSDMHFAKRNSAAGRAAVGFFSKLPVLGPRIKQGLAGHDPAALKAFEASLITLMKTNPSWLERTIVVATGDFSTWGEDHYGTAAVDFLKRAAQRASYAALDEMRAQRKCSAQNEQTSAQSKKGSRLIPVVPIYGNHDVWPAGFPLTASNEELDQRRTALRSQPPFHENRPVQLFPTSKGDAIYPPIALWALDTIVHDPIDNALAFGEIQQDWYWRPIGLSHQLTELQQRNNPPQIRIALTHHPIAGQDAFPLGHVLRNADSVAAQLQEPDPHTPGWPLVRIVLSGHTHKLYPPLGELPPGPPTNQSPLGQNQLQLTVGTLSQTRWNRSKQEQCWQLLRLYSEDHLPSEISAQQTCTIHIERTVLYRGNNAGEFEIRIPQNGDPTMTSERFSFEIAGPVGA